MLLKGKRALIFGVVNERSIAYGIAEQSRKHGARLGFGYASAPVRKRLEPISERLGGEFLIPCDVTSDAEIQAGVDVVREKWGGVDVLVHSIASTPSAPDRSRPWRRAPCRASTASSR